MNPTMGTRGCAMKWDLPVLRSTFRGGERRRSQTRTTNKRRRWLAVLGSLSTLGLTCADPAPPRLSPETPPGPLRSPIDEAHVMFIGHSLVNFHMPAMLADVAHSLGVQHEHAAHIQDGAPLKHNWERHEQARGTDARKALPTGRYDVVVLTEAVDLDDMIRWMEPAEYGGRFYRLAVEANPDVRVFLYETWHDRNLVRRGPLGCSRGGDWRAYLDDDLGKWEGIADDIARAHRGPPVAVVPGGQAMARLVDEIRAGQVPGIDNERSLFSDTVHLSPLGNYFIALVQFSTIYRRSPEGATAAPRDAEGRVHEVPVSSARALQRIAWDVVRGYAWSGVTERAD